MDWRGASGLLIFASIYLKVMLCSSLTVDQQLIVAENSVNKYRSTVELSYLTEVNILCSKLDELKQIVNKTIRSKLEDLDKINSAVNKTVWLITMMKPEAGLLLDSTALQKHMESDGNEMIKRVGWASFEPVSALSQNCVALINIVYINSNYSSSENLKFCLIENQEAKVFSCLESNVRAYAEFLSRLKQSVVIYSDRLLNLQTEIRDTMTIKLDSILNDNKNFTDNIIEQVLFSSNLTFPELVVFASDKINFNFRNEKHLINLTINSVEESFNIVTKYNNDLYNFRILFSNIQNILNITSEVVTKKTMNYSIVASVSEESSRFKDESWIRLSQFMNDTIIEVHQMSQRMNTVNDMMQTTDVKTLCHGLDKSELSMCLYEQINKSSEALKVSRNLMNDSTTLLEKLDENIKSKMQSIYNNFSAYIASASESLLEKYMIKFKDILKFELNKIDLTKRKLVEKITKLEGTNIKDITEYKNKLNNSKIIFNIFLGLIKLFENKKENDYLFTLKELNETMSNTYLTARENILTKISAIQTYKAINKTSEFFRKFKSDELKLLCKSENEKRFSTVDSVQCLENELSRIAEFVEALYNDYSQAYTELNNTASLAFHEVQQAMQSGLKRVLSLSSRQSVKDAVLECLLNVDFRKFDSVKLEHSLTLCQDPL